MDGGHRIRLQHVDRSDRDQAIGVLVAAIDDIAVVEAVGRRGMNHGGLGDAGFIHRRNQGVHRVGAFLRPIRPLAEQRRGRIAPFVVGDDVRMDIYEFRRHCCRTLSGSASGLNALGNQTSPKPGDA